MGRGPDPLPDTDDGHAERIRLSDQRTRKALSTRLAQSPAVLKMGIQITITFRAGEAVGWSKAMPEVDAQDLEYLASLIRPVTLKREPTYLPEVQGSLARFATDDRQRAAVGQLGLLRPLLTAPRQYSERVDTGTGEWLVPTGTTDMQVADRYLYSQLVHTDPAPAYLEHFDTEEQLSSLAGWTGHHLAYLAHQQFLANVVRPDLVPELTPWAGHVWTVCERLGVPLLAPPGSGEDAREEAQ